MDTRLSALAADLTDLLARCDEGRQLTEGFTVTIAGRPNAGKSSLLNALSGHDVAIVTAIPGTTRDVLRESVTLSGVPIWLSDTAGLRDADDPVEVVGIQRAHRAIAEADHVLYLIDSQDVAACAAAPAEMAALGRDRVTPVYTKADLGGSDRRAGELHISTIDGRGLDRLRDRLRAALSVQPLSTGALSARRRHVEALRQTLDHLAAAIDCADRAQTDLVAEELRAAQESLGVLTGTVSSDDLLGRIFSTFCIGK